MTEGALLESVILFLNRLFKPPNVGGRESHEAYSKWEHLWGREVAKKYMEPTGDLRGKTVLDVGCGLGGKTVAYEEAGAREIVGVDILVENVAASKEYAMAHTNAGRSAFLASDAAQLPFSDGSFDTVVANDAMEHFSRPARALEEMQRITKRGGAVWIFFTPHFSPLGSHLYDYIYTPWCHVLFSRSQIKRAIERILPERRPEASREQLSEQVEKIMTSYDQDLNHMTVRWFLRIVKNTPSLRITFLELRPAKFGFLKPLTRVPMVRELVTGFVVCRLEKAG